MKEGKREYFDSMTSKVKDYLALQELVYVYKI